MEIKRLVLTLKVPNEAIQMAIIALYPFTEKEMAENILLSHVRDCRVSGWDCKVKLPIEQNEHEEYYPNEQQEKILKTLFEMDIITNVEIDGNSLIEAMFYP